MSEASTTTISSYPFPYKATELLVKDNEALTVEDVDFRKVDSVTYITLMKQAYRLHPPSFIASLTLLLVGIINLAAFLIVDIYLVHPYISLGLFAAGTGLAVTMYAAVR